MVHIDSILQKIKMFIDEKMIPDLYDITYYYSEHYKRGKDLLSYGLFNIYNELCTLYMEPLVLTKSGIEVFDENKIQEKIDYAYYKSPENTYQPDKMYYAINGIFQLVMKMDIERAH